MTTRNESRSILRLGGWAALASGLISAVGFVCLVLMYVLFAASSTSEALAFGWINDVLAVVNGLLMLPVAVAVHVLLRSQRPTASRLALMIGIGADLAIVVLQSLLVVGTLTFQQEIGPVLVAFLFLVAWFVTTGYLGGSSGLLPNGVRMSLLAITYVAYPIWAFWLGRHLLNLAGEPVSSLSAGAERDLPTGRHWRAIPSSDGAPRLRPRDHVADGGRTTQRR